MFLSEIKQRKVYLIAESRVQVVIMTAPVIKRQPTMGVAFLSREREVLHREAAFKGRRQVADVLR